MTINYSPVIDPRILDSCYAQFIIVIISIRPSYIRNSVLIHYPAVVPTPIPPYEAAVGVAVSINATLLVDVTDGLLQRNQTPVTAWRSTSGEGGCKLSDLLIT